MTRISGESLWTSAQTRARTALPQPRADAPSAEAPAGQDRTGQDRTGQDGAAPATDRVRRSRRGSCTCPRPSPSSLQSAITVSAVKRARAIQNGRDSLDGRKTFAEDGRWKLWKMGIVDMGIESKVLDRRAGQKQELL